MDGEGDHYKEPAEEGKVEAEEDAWTWGAWGAWGVWGAWSVSGASGEWGVRGEEG